MNDLPLARRDVIAHRLAAGEPAVASTLAGEFGVSEDAIRRDLRALAADGLCRRVYGGALPVFPVMSPASSPMAVRINQDQQRKDSLARVGAALVQAHELLMLDSGSTNLAVVKFLPADYRLTIVTNSIAIAAEVLQRKDLKLILLGGVVDPHLGGCVDAGAVAAVAQMNIDRCFIGACALSTQLGVCAFNPMDALFKRAVCAASAQRVVLATTAKLATRAPHRVAQIKDIHHFVVENDVSVSQLEALHFAGSSVTKAPPPS